MSKYDFGNKLYALRTEKNLTQICPVLILKL